MTASYTILSAPAPAYCRWIGAPRSRRARWLAATSTLALGVPLAVGFSLFLFSGKGDDLSPGELSPLQVAELALPDLPQEVAQAVAADDSASASPAATPGGSVPPATPARRVARLEGGETLIGLLMKLAVPEAEAHEAMSALSKVYNPRHMKPGKDVTVVFDKAGVFSGLEFNPEVDRSVRVERKPDGYKAAAIMRPLSNNVMAAVVKVNGSLHESGVKAGIPAGAMNDLVRALSYSVDFQRDIREGDSFRVLFEVRRSPEGTLVRTGKILYAEVNLRGRTIPVYFYQVAGGREGYFDPQGRSLKRSLLRTPVNAVRVSSGYGMRIHPVLGYSRMHRGIDFAAPTGTKIYASGDGVIAERGWKNGYGNYIRIRHNSSVSTAYAHMNRFEGGLSQGSRVKQGQIIGYVGATGRTTGPHLHYEIMVGGTQVNPLRIANLETGDTLKGRDLARFKGMVAAVAAQFRDVTVGKAIDVSYHP